MAITNETELLLCWKRFYNDIIDKRVFFINSFHFELIKFDSTNWLKTINNKLNNGTYSIGDNNIIDVPKPNYGIRAGSSLGISDGLVYTFVVSKLLPKIKAYISKNYDYGYQFEDITKVKWLKNRFECWDQFRIDSLIKMNDPEINYLVISDISTYYDNIDLITISNDLAQIECDKEIIDLLSKMLNRWVQINNRGIPQGFSASDILAKYYLTNIDILLDRAGYSHIRFVDDYRIFCKTITESKKSITKLTSLLRKRGLALNSAKTYIFNKEDAIKYLEGIIPTLRDISKGYNKSIITMYDNGFSSVDFSDIAKYIDVSTNNLPNQIILDAYKQYIESVNNFSKTLFHFLLNKLGENKNDYALAHTLSVMRYRPHETESILRYIKTIDKFNIVQNEVADILISSDSVYFYQKYQIIKFFNENRFSYNSKTIDAVRSTYKNPSCPDYLRSECRYFLKQFGDYADLENILSEYAAASEPVQYEIICSMGRMTKNRRNAFYARVEKDGYYHKLSVQYSKNNRD